MMVEKAVKTTVNCISALLMITDHQESIATQGRKKSQKTSSKRNFGSWIGRRCSADCGRKESTRIRQTTKQGYSKSVGEQEEW